MGSGHSFLLVTAFGREEEPPRWRVNYTAGGFLFLFFFLISIYLRDKTELDKKKIIMNNVSLFAYLLYIISFLERFKHSVFTTDNILYTIFDGPVVLVFLSFFFFFILSPPDVFEKRSIYFFLPKKKKDEKKILYPHVDTIPNRAYLRTVW